MKTGVRKERSRRMATLKPDSIPWSVKTRPERIVAIGDVHGDIVGLASILHDLGLIDKTGSWTGGGTHVVLNGDLVGGRNARLLLRLVLRLEKEAKAAGGAVHCLLGNHDIQVFFKSCQKRKGKTLFREYPVEGAEKRTVRHAFTGDTAPARWMRERNAVVRIGDTIFTHAGLNVWAFRHHLKRINATIRAWIRFWQDIGERPDPFTEWAALGPESNWSAPSTGPLWTRSFRVPRGGKKDKKQSNAPSDEELDKLLRMYRCRRMVIAHSPNPGKEVLLEHPYYGDRVVMIDTRISDAKNGRLSCIEILGDRVLVRYTERSKVGRKIKERVLEELK